MCLRITYPLPLLLRGRDLVCSMSSFFKRLETVPLMNSEPLPEGKPSFREPRRRKILVIHSYTSRLACRRSLPSIRQPSFKLVRH